jgi:serine/threonine protein kinase
MLPQSSIAHYRITTKLGDGGMGVVYRARDTKLNRDVAIKILPDSFAEDPDRLARFEREARILASLNHPNIAGIYGVEERAIVMELIEGDTLAAPLPLNEALEIALQLTQALEYAHQKGVVHRDLKPANIKITPDGLVKVLDFGLAKPLSAESRSADPAFQRRQDAGRTEARAPSPARETAAPQRFNGSVGKSRTAFTFATRRARSPVSMQRRVRRR